MNPVGGSPANFTPLETLASYTPELVTRRLAQLTRGGAESGAAVEERFPAAVFFADVSGFTALTELLAARRPGGLEFLTRLLNDYFGQIINRVLAHGGDIVRFAGDGILAVWRGEAEPVATHLLRAAQCALQVQAQLQEYVVGGDQPLVLRVGLGAGLVSAMHVGGVNDRWEVALVGEPVEQAGRAEQQAPPGAVVIAPEAWPLLSVVGAGRPLSPAGFVRLESVLYPIAPRALSHPVLTPAAERVLRGYLPRTVQARLAVGQVDWLAELRTVTTLFVQLSRPVARWPLNQVQAALQSVQGELSRHEGSLNNLTVDEAGLTLVAAFGLPPQAHEDNAARGVLAALAIQTTLAGLGLTTAVGVATGRVFCGVVGNERRRQYTMLGDTINVAARLMQAAGSGRLRDGEYAVLCDAATQDLAQARVEFEGLPPLIVKGKAEPVAVCRPRRERRRAAHADGGLVGRVAERAWIAEAVRALARGATPDMLLIESEPGVGKTRLAEEVRLQAEAAGVVTWVGAAEAMERATPYFVWREVFLNLFDLAGVETPAARRAQVLARLTPARQAQAPLLEAVLPLEWPETDVTRSLAGGARADSTRDLLAELLEEAAGRRPHVIILEDGQWMDTAAWELARALRQRAVPLLLVMTTRPLELPWPAGYGALRAAPGTRHLRLEALLPEEAWALIRQRLGVRSLPEPVGQFITARAEGNAFFIEQLAYALRDSGALLIRDGVCHVRPGLDLAAVDLPDTVQGVVTGRIDRLHPGQQLTLKVASVIGRVFSYRLLEAVHPIDGERRLLPAQLGDLERLDLTALATPAPDLAYSFKHSITQDVAYNLMLLTQRQRLHRAVAEWYEHTGLEDPASQAAVLAHHWRNSDRPERAFEYLERAGEQALAVSASREALGFFEQALDLLNFGAPLAAFRRQSPVEQQRQAARLAACSGQALLGLSDFAGARGRLEAALTLARALDLPRVAARALSLLGRLAIDQGQYAEAREHCEASARLAQAAGDEAMLVNVLFDLAYLAMLERADDAAEQRAGESLALARRLDDHFHIAQAANLLGILALYQERITDGQAHFHTYLEMARRLGHRRSIALGLMNLGEVDYTLGQLDSAQARIAESLSLGRAIGDRMIVTIDCTLLGRVLCGLGDLPRAARYLREALEVALAIETPPRVLYALLGVAQLRLARGRLEPAVELIGLASLHPARSAEELNFATPLLASARAQLPAAALEAALARGADLDLAATAAAVLAELAADG
ncbi:MAG: AAA family ATPase [Anaerolineales bacterium]|nr:AAA family ATPase [Anaerolineales bacterium]